MKMPCFFFDSTEDKRYLRYEVIGASCWLGTQGECFRPLAFLISGHFVMAAIYLVSSIHGLSAILASAPIELSC